jgi:hypothetical protein
MGRLTGYVALPSHLFHDDFVDRLRAQTKNDKYRVSKLLALPPVFKSCTGLLALFLLVFGRS